MKTGTFSPLIKIRAQSQNNPLFHISVVAHVHTLQTQMAPPGM